MNFRQSISHFFRTGLLSAGLLALLPACTALENGASGLDPELRPRVPVSFSLSVAPGEAGTPPTKTDYEPDVWGSGGQADAVKTVLLLQFEWQDGTEASARLIGQQFVRYGENASLIASDVKNTLLVAANVGGKAGVTPGTSLDDFLNIFNAELLTSPDDLTGSGIWYSPDGTDRYLRMSGSTVLDGVAPDNADIGAITLKRNCAKVVVRLKNSGSSRVAVDRVQLRDINRKYYYVTNQPGFADPYDPTDPARMDLAPQRYPDGGAEGTGADAGYRIYTYYVPANVRGSIANASQKGKNYQALRGATYFSVHATDVNTAEEVVYNYYLGADLTSDFNLLPNHKYSYTVDINDRGTASGDGRIEELGDLTFTRDANCYMLKPPSWAGATRDFLIPVRRAAVFWNEPGMGLGVYGAGNSTPHYTLDEESQWVVSIVWNEIYKADGSLATGSELLVTSSGTGFSDGHFRIRVASGMRGNALVALKKKAAAVPAGKQITDPSDTETYVSDPKYHTNGDILWSWHLWVTDYDPYVPMAVAPGTYIYAVPNGEIHRHADKSPSTLWTSGAYADAFMMDRNLGAVVPQAGVEDAKKSYGLYYQWGRKDPFVNAGAVATKAADSTGEPGEGAPKQNIRYSIHHPDTYLTYSGNWTAYETGGFVLGSPTATWNDPRANEHGADNCEAGKSIYDPCPYGWALPMNGAWADFDQNTTVMWSGQPKCASYYPEGAASGKGRILYPTSGYRTINGAVSAQGTGGNSMSATPRSATAGYYLALTSSRPIPSHYDSRAFASAARCVRTDLSLPY